MLAATAIWTERLDITKPCENGAAFGDCVWIDQYIDIRETAVVRVLIETPCEYRPFDDLCRQGCTFELRHDAIGVVQQEKIPTGQCDKILLELIASDLFNCCAVAPSIMLGATVTLR
jgi:hypothetical protein